MSENTLYKLTREEARVLCEYFNYDIQQIGVLLYNRGKASDVKRGFYKANKLIKFAKGL